MGAPVDGSEEEVADTGGCWCVAVGWVRPWMDAVVVAVARRGRKSSQPTLRCLGARRWSRRKRCGGECSQGPDEWELGMGFGQVHRKKESRPGVGSELSEECSRGCGAPARGCRGLGDRAAAWAQGRRL